MMMTLEEIQNAPNISLALMQEGIRQAEMRLQDALTTKKQLECKLYFLMAYYVTTIGIVSYLYSLPIFSHWTSALAIIAGLFIIAILQAFNALKGMPYGTLGRYPDTWLQESSLGQDEHGRALLLAYVLFGYQKRIEDSDKSNDEKTKWGEWSIFTGWCAYIGFLTVLLLQPIFKMAL
jgi:hypothetical protein